MSLDELLRAGQILSGPLFNEPMRVVTARPGGAGAWVAGLVGTRTERFRSVTITASDLETLAGLESAATYDADGKLLRLGLQAYALGIAWEFDPYFGLSISRVDPLPHQLEAVYDYLLKVARVHFLLADDAGAGKTIMAGLLIRELKLRGLAERILIVGPANLAFQWQRELKEKFDEKFLVLKGHDLREQFGVNQWLEQKQVITSLDLAKREDDLVSRQEATTLDRVHAAMLLQSSGRANALRALIKAEQQRGPEFIRLANGLSALYPKGTEERRLVEAMLQAVPR